MGFFSNKVEGVSQTTLVNSLRCLDMFCNDSAVNNGLLVELNHSLGTIKQHMLSTGVDEYAHKNIIFVLTHDELCIRLATQTYQH